ncbi:hypothetical protein [Mycobacterium sp. M26]|uniref:hypothetical protein n=1 Tax=Mycobacterium sp. M26 TaxID=1762962 RepID=UPI00073E4D6E|nr:hypothetical protein [Mycobacterium sp. M26]
MNDIAASIEQPHHKSTASGRYRTFLLTVLTVAAVAAVGLLGTLTWYAITDHMADAAARKIEVDNSALAKTVTVGLQNLIDTNESTMDGHFRYEQDLTLFQVVPGGSEYRGLVNARSDKGTEVPVEVTAYADTVNGPLFYEIDPSSNMRLAQIAEKEHPKTCSAYQDC